MSTPDSTVTIHAAEVTFRPDFCSPAYLNGLLHLQPLHWLRIARRPVDGGVAVFEFVIPAAQSNLVCVLGTEVPLLEAKLGCKVRKIPLPDFVAPDGLSAFSVTYGEPPQQPRQWPTAGPTAVQAAHNRFLASLCSMCVRLQLGKICVGPATASSGCAACAKVRTHTKSVRGSSVARPRLRPPPVLHDLARPRTRRSASVVPTAAAFAIANAASFVTKAAGDCHSTKIYVSPHAASSTNLASAALTESTTNVILDRLIRSIVLHSTNSASLLTAAASETLRVCSGDSRRRPSRWRQFSLDFCVAALVADTVLEHELLRAQVADVFDDWAVELAGRLLASGARIVASGVCLAAAASSQVADVAAGHLLCSLVEAMSAEVSAAEQLVVRISLPCDWRTGRSLLGLRPMRRNCPSCGSLIAAEPVGPSGYRLTVRSFGRRCSRHTTMLQLADCARSSKDAALGGLLLQEVAALPICQDN